MQSTTLCKYVANDFNILFADIGHSLANSIDSLGPLIIYNAVYQQYAVFTVQTVTQFDNMRYITIYELLGMMASRLQLSKKIIIFSNYLHVLNTVSLSTREN